MLSLDENEKKFYNLGGHDSQLTSITRKSVVFTGSTSLGHVVDVIAAVTRMLYLE